LVLDVAHDDDSVSVPAHDAAGRRYEAALVLVRVHDQPVGMARLAVPDAGMEGKALYRAVASQVGGAVDEHLEADGASITGSSGPPRCVTERDRLLTDAPPVTVVIPTRERPELLRRCLDSLWAGSYPPDRLTVVIADNVPETARTRLLVEELAATRPVEYVREDASGSASARNAGLSRVGTELVAFTDDDAVLDRHWLAALATGYERTPDASCVTGLLLPLEISTPAQLWFERYGGFSRGFEPRIFDLVDHRPTDAPLYPYSAGIFGTGNNMSFRTEALRDLGGFDPALGNGTPALGGVDSEVLLRAILRGHTLRYEPTALVWHEHRREYAALRRQVHSYGTGLTAYLLKTLLDDPGRIPGFVRLVPRGMRYALSSTSAKNSGKSEGYPGELTRLELLGMVRGPVAYARSRRRYGPHRTHRPGPAETVVRGGTP
jgi:GT2 family glycosyltransferase